MDREPFVETYFKLIVGLMVVFLAVFCVGVAAIGLINLGFLPARSPDADWRVLPISVPMFVIGWLALRGLLRLRRVPEKRGAIYPPE
jgi:hypothetical protein